ITIREENKVRLPSFIYRVDGPFRAPVDFYRPDSVIERSQNYISPPGIYFKISYNFKTTPSGSQRTISKFSLYLSKAPVSVKNSRPCGRYQRTIFSFSFSSLKTKTGLNSEAYKFENFPRSKIWAWVSSGTKRARASVTSWERTSRFFLQSR